MLIYIAMAVLSAGFAALWQRLRVKGKHMLFHTKRHQFYANSGMLFACLTFFTLFIINACSGASNDYQNYVREFHIAVNGHGSKMELGFVLIAKLVDHMGFDFQMEQAVLCLLGYALLLLCIRDYSDSFATSVLLYIAIGYYMLLGMNQLRQFVALMFVLYAYRYIPKGKFLPYAVFVVAGALFHMTAIVMLPVYFVLRMRLRASHFIVAIAVLAPFNLFYKQLLQLLFAMFKPEYLGTSYATRDIYLDVPAAVMGITVCAILILYRKRIEARGELDVMFAKMFLISTIIIILCGWLPENARFAYYFNLPVIMLIPNLLHAEKNKTVKYLLLGGLLAVYGFILYVKAPGWGVIPYQPFFA